MTGGRSDVLDRGRAEREAHDEYVESHRSAGYAIALREIRESLVHRFYADTLVKERYGYRRDLGPESPAPEIRLADTSYEDLGWMGGQYRYVAYTFDLDGFAWRVDWDYARHFGWEMRFFVKRTAPFRTRWLRLWRSRTEWIRVYSPGSLVEVSEARS